jgi:hypothetical protein
VAKVHMGRKFDLQLPVVSGTRHWSEIEAWQAPPSAVALKVGSFQS